MVTPTSWMYAWLIGARGFGKCCANRLPTISNDISGDSTWSFVVSETKTKWNVYCVARQYHDSRYVHWIRQIYTRAVELATHPGVFHRISHCSKTKFEKGNDRLSKQPQTFSLHPSMVLSTCVSHLLYYLPAARFQNTRIFFIKFYFIWTYQERFEHNSEISRKKLAVIFAMLTCLLW